MNEVTVSAPGKAIVAGEYVVLRGAPAISMALNRRAQVHIKETRDASHSVSAPGYLPGSFRFQSTTDFRIEWLDEPPSHDSFSLFEAVWKRARAVTDSSFVLALDTREFFDAPGGSKLGLGSSAALATALAAALAESHSLAGSFDVLAADSHRDFQDGSGSGIDVATAIHGGVIEYQVGKPVVSLRWPDDLAYCVLWSGQGVSTVDKISRLANRVELPSQGLLTSASRQLVDQWMTGNIPSLLSLLQHYTEALRSFSDDHALNIFEGGHDKLFDIAANFENTVYKPCGAGGGDIGIVMAQSQKEVDLFAADAVKSGFLPLDVSLDTAGVVVEGNSLC